jgi:hypothetical protein
MEAPTTGHFIDRPPRKKLVLFCPAFLRQAMYNPNERLPPITTAKISQSIKVNDKAIIQFD